MAVKARTWTSVDKAISEMLADKKTKTGLSYRAIAQKTGLGYVRVSDISHAINGTPTVVEFLSICSAFDLDPVETLRQIIDLARRMEARERQAALPSASVVEDAVAAAIRDHERYGLAANTDPMRDIEAETPDE